MSESQILNFLAVNETPEEVLGEEELLDPQEKEWDETDDEEEARKALHRGEED